MVIGISGQAAALAGWLACLAGLKPGLQELKYGILCFRGGGVGVLKLFNSLNTRQQIFYRKAGGGHTRNIPLYLAG
jgi:hypothetical protein